MSNHKKYQYASYKPTQQQRGSSLVEVMVALLILAVGLLGYISLITSGVTVNQRAYSLSQVTFLAEDYADRVRANRGAVASYNIVLGDSITSSADCLSNSCSAAQMADWDKAEWMATLESTLHHPEASVVINNSTITIIILHRLAEGREGTGGDDMLDDLETYELVTNI